MTDPHDGLSMFGPYDTDMAVASQEYLLRSNRGSFGERSVRLLVSANALRYPPRRQ